MHHDHLVCTKCGKIIEFTNEDMERLQVKIAAKQRFHMLQHRMEIYGLCDECLAQRRPLMPLAMAKPEERVVIREMVGGQNARARLASMGLRLGDRIEIINNTGQGQGRLILGHDCTKDHSIRDQQRGGKGVLGSYTNTLALYHAFEPGIPCVKPFFCLAGNIE